MSQQARLFACGLVAIGTFAAAIGMLGPPEDIRSLVVPAAIAALVAAGLAWTVGRSFGLAMSRLLEAARSIAAGDFAASPPLSGPSEIADVGAAVHSLAQQLRDRAQAVQAADALVTGLVEALNEAVIVADSSGRVIRINAAGRDVFGVQEAVPFDTEKLPRAQALHQTLQSTLRGQSVEPVEMELRGRQVSLAARPLVGGGAVLAALDLTPLRKLEAVRRDFVANVSHELRTPLTVVHGFAETLATEDMAPETKREFSEKIRSNTERMQRIVDDLLDLSRIESGGWVPAPTRVVLRPLVGEVLAQVGPQAREKGLSITVQIGEGADAVHADRIAVVQTLSNLVENAVRHTSAGGVTIFSEPSDSGVWLGVRDTGHGIPYDHLPRIFERFYRADPGRSRQSGGTGLGLAIVKHLVEAHGGLVAAESDVGHGTTVRAFFPGAGSV